MIKTKKNSIPFSFQLLYSMFLIFFFSIFFLFGILAPVFSKIEILNLGGSTSVFPLFQGLAKKSDLPFAQKIEYFSVGSSGGFWNTVRSKNYEIGFISKEYTYETKPEVSKHLNGLDITNFEIARDGIIFIYNLPSGCQASASDGKLSLTKQEIKKIYGRKHATKWQELSGITCGTASQSKEIIRISRENGSGTKSVFEKKIMDEEKVFQDIVLSSSQPILKTLENSDESEGYLGYVSFSYKKRIANISQIQIAKYEGTEATATNIQSGSYSLFRPFIGIFLTKNKNKKIFQDFFTFLLNENTKKIIEELNFIYVFKRASVQ